MKKILGLLVVLLATPNAFTAEMMPKVDFRLRYIADINKDGDEKADPGSQSHWEQRLKASMTFQASEKLTGNVTLLHNHWWGNQGMESFGYPNPGTPDQLTPDNGLIVNEAFGTWMVSDELAFKFGRSSLEMADGSIMAKNDYQAVPTAFDGIEAIYDWETFRAALWYMDFVDILEGPSGIEVDGGSSNETRSQTDEEAVSYGLAFDIKSLPDWIKMVNVHVMQNNSDSLSDSLLGQPRRSATRYGVTLGGDVIGLDYNFTYATHIGTMDTPVANNNEVTESDQSGNMLDIKLGYSLPDILNLRIYGGFHSDTGEDGNSQNGMERYNSFYYDFHNNAGDLDVLQWGNLTYTNLGLTLDPIENLTIGVSYFMFEASQENDNFHATGGGSKGISRFWEKSTTSGQDLGSEIDLWVTKQFGDQLTLSFSYGEFAPGDYFAMEDGRSYDSYTRLFLEGHLAF